LWFEASLGNQFSRPYLKQTLCKRGLVDWLKVEALSSNPSTEKKYKKPVINYLAMHKDL
jgi:hypothetical protein